MNKKRFSKIYVEITNICNLKCSFCSSSSRNQMHMKAKDFEYICERIKRYTNLITLHVKGEPLLNPNLEEILCICSKYNIMVNITTNATLLEEKLDILLKSKAIRQINCSLHSAEQNGMDIKTYVGKVFKAVDKINDKTNIIISYRLWNLENIEKNQINKSILQMIGRHYKIQNIVELAQKNNFIECHKNIFLNQDLKFEWPSMESEKKLDFGKCYGLRNQIAILVNGDVVPCCLDSEGNILLGNIFENSLEEILESEKSKLIIKGFQKGRLVEELCQRCGYIKKFNNI